MTSSYLSAEAGGMSVEGAHVKVVRDLLYLALYRQRGRLTELQLLSF
jgi:hypothetical protein